jgi:diaminobutyrate-2-oxoglutarate transaminase
MGTQAEIELFQRHESEVRGYCRRFDTVFAKAQGSVLVDTAGRRYIDFLASAGALNYGHNDPDMVDALIAHLRNLGLAAGLDLHTEAKRQFLQSFTSTILEPRGLKHRVQFTGPTGANAVEAALKLARKVTGRHNVIAFTNGYHGVSMGALAATGSRYNRMGAQLPGVTRMPLTTATTAPTSTPQTCWRRCWTTLQAALTRRQPSCWKCRARVG